MENLEKYLDSIGEKGAIQRLEVIASMDLGKRSEAAQRASQNRTRRKELMNSGMSFETACLVVNTENQGKRNNLKNQK